MSQNKVIALAKKYVTLVKKVGISVDRAYLFGSYAKNKAKSYSDIDISIISSEFGRNWIKEGVKLSMIAGQVDERIEPHPFHPREMANKYSSIVHEIKTHGILLTK